MGKSFPMKSKTILIKSPNQKFEYHTSLCHSLFNPRSREGSDNHDPEAIKMHKAFQSSLPRRERQVSSDYLLDLNPISIHAPAKGATHGDILIRKISHISIHAPTKGATL